MNRSVVDIAWFCIDVDRAERGRDHQREQRGRDHHLDERVAALGRGARTLAAVGIVGITTTTTVIGPPESFVVATPAPSTRVDAVGLDPHVDGPFFSAGASAR